LGKAILQQWFDKKDHTRALNTLRYIHANPKSAGMRQGFFYNFSNYGSHWGSKLLPVVSQPQGKKSAGQMTLPWAFREPSPEAISLVAEKFVLANGYPTVPGIGKATGGGGI
jgi:putative transposase